MGRGMNRQSTEDFQGSKVTLFDTIMMDTCHYTLVKTHRMYNIKSRQNLSSKSCSRCNYDHIICETKIGVLYLTDMGTMGEHI